MRAEQNVCSWGGAVPSPPGAGVGGGERTGVHGRFREEAAELLAPTRGTQLPQGVRAAQMRLVFVPSCQAL